MNGTTRGMFSLGAAWVIGGLLLTANGCLPANFYADLSASLVDSAANDVLARVIEAVWTALVVPPA